MGQRETLVSVWYVQVCRVTSHQLNAALCLRPTALSHTVSSTATSSRLFPRSPDRRLCCVIICRRDRIRKRRQSNKQALRLRMFSAVWEVYFDTYCCVNRFGAVHCSLQFRNIYNNCIALMGRDDMPAPAAIHGYIMTNSGALC